MISPTGLGIRNDVEGSGAYGANRGSRKHNGIDYVCKEGQRIVAPFNMQVTRISKPKADSPMSGIAWTAGSSEGRMWYFTPLTEIIGEYVVEGQLIGYAQSVSKDYGLPDMTDHIHFQIKK